jgi:amidophosphoribosyltransferase
VADLLREYPEMAGKFGVGHVRYATNSESPIQPLISPSDGDHCALAFNGEVEGGDTKRLMQAMRSLNLARVRGAYCLAMTSPSNDTVLAARDPFGFHPLYYSQELRCVASEVVADPDVSWESVPPGCIIRCDTGKVVKFLDTPPPSRCFFEFVYFANVAGEFDGKGIWEVRRSLGRKLAMRETNRYPYSTVVPVPDSGIAAAEAFAEYLDIPITSALFRNRQADRTFIREGGQQDKYTIIPDAIRGLDIFLIDDSIVRGKTLNHLVPRLLEAGAKSVHVRVTCPPITHACRYGINITEAGAKSIRGANSIRFLEPEELDWMPGMCKACVTGVYPNEQQSSRSGVYTSLGSCNDQPEA